MNRWADKDVALKLAKGIWIADGHVKSGSKIRLVAIMLTAAAASAIPRALIAQPATAPATTSLTSINVAALVQADLDQLAAVLNDIRATQEQRDNAASRLVSRPSPETRRILAGALVNLNLGGQLAVARALQQQARPDPEFINPLFAALTGQNPDRPLEASARLAEASARALATYKGNADVISRLVGLTRKSPAPYRAQVIEALRTSNDRKAAETLVAILADASETSSIRGAAARALSRMTGQNSYGQSAELWNAWLTTMPRTDAEFQLRLSTNLASRAEASETRATELADYVREMLTKQYLATPAAQKQDQLLLLLSHPQADVRSIGAGLAKDDARLDGKPTTAVVKTQLRKMVGDSSAEVRLAAADALAQINDADSLQAVLTQLEQETDDQVQQSLIFVLNQFRNVAAVPSLLKRLNDANHSYAVQLTALAALAETGPKIAENPELARQTARALLDAYEKRPQVESNKEIRKAFVRAMVPLRSEELLGRVFYPIMNIQRDEGPDMRRLAIKGIGELHNPDSRSLIANSLADGDAGVRLAAITALGDLPGAETYAPQIIERLKQETDESIKENAWRVLANLLQQQTLTAGALQTYADAFRNDARKQFEIYRILRDLQIKQLGQDSTPDDLMATRQNLAAAAMHEKEFKVAAAEFKEALSYAVEAKKNTVIIDTLRDGRMNALLQSRDYEGVREFAGQSFREDPGSKQALGGKIKTRVEELRDAGQTTDALALIREAQSIQPPLEKFYTEDLSRIEKEIQQANGTTSGPGALAAPQNAPRTAPLTPDTTASGR